MSRDPYTITVPADKKWEITVSLLKYEQAMRKEGYESEATDIIILCDDIEQQIQEQFEQREVHSPTLQD